MNFDEYAHNPLSERLVDILMKKNGNIDDALFYRVLVAFYLGKCASMMRTNVINYDKQIVPVNVYALNLMPSGFGKGLAVNVLESNIMHEFRHRFLEETFPIKATENLTRLASSRALKDGTEEEVALEKLGAEFTALGELMFSFDSGTPAALKQMRTKLLMSKAGSMNFQIDEIGSNLQKCQEMLEVFLELYDVGKVKQKLIKNTAENIRLADMEGITPANLLMFGTPSKLLDGGRIEELIMDFFETGFGRRCFFGIIDIASTTAASTKSPEEILDDLLNSNLGEQMNEMSDHFEDLADVTNFGQNLPMPREGAILCIEYQQNCKARTEKLRIHDDTGRAEMLHRYWKVIKLAGAYAFSEGSPEITLAHFQAAIKLAEESGDAFKRIMSRDKNYVRLAKYISESGLELTQADLVEELQFYRGTAGAKAEMFQLAVAWGYSRNIIIQKKYNEGIEFISGSMLEETNLDKLILSHSNDGAYNYVPVDTASFTRLHEMTQITNYHFCNHRFKGGHREGVNALRGFNMIMLDIDNGCTLDTAKLLLKDYTYHIYTTKSHGLEGKGDRFRIVMPISHILKLSGNEYKEFMSNLFEWLPFDSDEQTGQRVCKWACNEGQYWYNEGKLIDALQFIPATTKNEKRKQSIKNLTNFDNLEKWFAIRMVDGQRSNEMIKFALLLVDSGMDMEDVEDRVMNLNNKLEEGLTEGELASTVLRTAAKRFIARNT